MFLVVEVSDEVPGISALRGKRSEVKKMLRIVIQSVPLCEGKCVPSRVSNLQLSDKWVRRSQVIGTV